MTEIRNLRVLPHASFTVVRNTAARDQALTFRARGLLVWMLSHESGRLITAAAMIDAGPDGRDNVQAALRELETTNYIRRIRYRGPKGQWAHEMIVTDVPNMFLDKTDTKEEPTNDEIDLDHEPPDHRQDKLNNERNAGGFADHDRIGEHR